MRNKAVLIASVAASAMAPPASADTLGQAIADAYRNNPRLQAQRAQLRVVDESVIQAAAPYRLNANIVSSLSYDQQRQRTFTGDFDTFDVKSMGAVLTAQQIISNGGRTAAQVSAAEADVLSAREGLREAENLILLEVVDSYISVRRDTDVVAIQERSVSSYQRQVQQARAREQAGDLTRTDIAQAEAQLLIIRAQQAQARASLEQSRARFTAVVGRPPQALEPEPALPGLPASIDAAYQIAERESPTLWQSIMNERAGRERISLARAQRAPTVTVQGRFGYNSPTTYQTRDLGRYVSGTVNVTLPLLTAGVIGSQVRQAIAGQQQLAYLIEDTRRTLNQNLLGAWNQSITGRDQLTAGEAATVAAESALTGVRRGFAEGFRSNFEVLDSEQRLLNAQLIVATARYNRYAGQAALLAGLGRLEAAAIDQAVPVYDAEKNLSQQRGRQFGPFQLILKPIDELQRSSGASRIAPQVPAPTGPVAVGPATVPPPEGSLATGFPTRDGQPDAPAGDPPHQR